MRETGMQEFDFFTKHAFMKSSTFAGVRSTIATLRGTLFTRQNGNDKNDENERYRKHYTSTRYTRYSKLNLSTTSPIFFPRFEPRSVFHAVWIIVGRVFL